MINEQISNNHTAESMDLFVPTIEHVLCQSEPPDKPGTNEDLEDEIDVLTSNTYLLWGETLNSDSNIFGTIALSGLTKLRK